MAPSGNLKITENGQKSAHFGTRLTKLRQAGGAGIGSLAIKIE
jgi:hypothetical protein